MPKLYGEATADEAPYWTSNWNAMAMKLSTTVYVWDTQGARHSFAWNPNCANQSTVLQALGSPADTRSSVELYCSAQSAGFTNYTLVRADGSGEVFSETFTVSPSPTDRRYVTRLFNSHGATVATVYYAQPVATSWVVQQNCPSGAVAFQPYIRQIAGESVVLNFYYNERTVNGVTTCPLSQIDVGPSIAEASPAVQYSYSSSSVAPLLRASRISAQVSIGEEQYSEIPSHVMLDGGLLVFSGTEIGQGLNIRETYRFVVPPFGFAVSEASGVDDLATFSRDGGVYYVQSSRELGDFSGSVVRTEAHVLTQAPEFGGVRRSTRDVYCSAGSCSDGQERWQRVSDAGFVFVVAPPDGGALVSSMLTDGGAWLPASVHRGVSATGLSNLGGLDTVGNCKGTECEWYGWSRVGSAMRLSTTTRKSVLVADAGVVTTRSYSPSGQLVSEITTGFTKGVTGSAPVAPSDSPVSKSYGTLYKLTRSSGGGCGGGSDSLGRVVEVQGPCEISGGSCVGAAFPLTQYFYHDSSSSPSDVGHLMFVYRFPNGCSSSPLITQYWNYDSFGRPQAVSDENVVSWFYSFDSDGRVLTRTVTSPQTMTWTYRYLAGRLRSVSFPDGNSMRYCYSPTTAASFSALSSTYDCPEPAIGELDSPTLVVRSAGAAPSSGSTAWSEAVRNTYSPLTKNLVRVESFSQGESVARRDVSFSHDAENRLVSSKDTTDTNASRVRFAHDDLVTAIGPAFNVPPLFCVESNGTVSTKCTTFDYDDGRRLARVNTPLLSGQIETRLVSNTNGDVCDVATNSSNSPACEIATARANGSSVSFEYDDFGNVLAAFTPNSVEGSSKGGVRYRYDPAGNVVLRQSTEQALSQTSTTFAWDALSRRTSVALSSADGGVTLYSWVYDGVSWPCSNPRRNLKGRVAASTDPTGTTFYSYDEFGRVLMERLVRPSGSCTGNFDTAPMTSYSYTGNGELEKVTYPHGLVVRYDYGDAGTEVRDRILGVSVMSTLSDGGAGSWRSLVSDVKWEPFGGLRYYRVNAADGGIGVERVIGNTTLAPQPNEPFALCPTVMMVEQNSTRTGRPAALFVSSGSGADVALGSSSAGNVLRQIYTWKADQVAQISSCLLSNPDTAQIQTFSYDQALRLTQASFPNWANTGGTHATELHAIDGRGNRLSYDVSGYGHIMYYEIDGGTLRPDALTKTRPYNSGNWLDKEYDYDADGRVVQVRWRADSTGQPAKKLTFSYHVGGGVADSALKYVAAQTGDAILPWTYVYDADNRRHQKIYPAGSTDEFFWRGTQLLEDRGNATSGGTTSDEYIWLDGQPIAIRRTRFDASWNRYDDATADCARDIDKAVPGAPAMACGWRYLVSDVAGRVVLSLDDSRRITGVYEFNAYGNFNRMNWWGDSPHPYQNNAHHWLGAPWQPKRGLEEVMRVRYAIFDVETWADFVRGYSSSVKVYEGTGNHGYSLVTQWLPVNADQQISFFLDSNGRNVATGATLEFTEYRRFASGATPLELRLRLPGQYYDEETDLVENWNRYYDANTGRYLSPEPMLQNPWYLLGEALDGYSVPTYAYAGNNPLAFIDEDGLSRRRVLPRPRSSPRPGNGGGGGSVCPPGYVIVLKPTYVGMMMRGPDVPVCVPAPPGVNPDDLPAMTPDICGITPKLLHPESSMSKSSLDYWRKQPTDKILDSLKTGSKEPLIMKPDGTVMQGNTRLKVLMERGFDVGSIPFEPY